MIKAESQKLNFSSAFGFLLKKNPELESLPKANSSKPKAQEFRVYNTESWKKVNWKSWKPKVAKRIKSSIMKFCESE